ncbi:MAG: NUDIX domain-containing protein [bacterium]|nr:NUDIX domain-containing protein [bacterium]
MSERLFHQVAIVPWREGVKGPDILLVSTREGAEVGEERWVLPQGGIEPGQTPVQAAAEEAWEEAGVEGMVEPVSFTGFDYEIGAGRCRVAVHRLQVRKEAPSWPEKDKGVGSGCRTPRRWRPYPARCSGGFFPAFDLRMRLKYMDFRGSLRGAVPWRGRSYYGALIAFMTLGS